MVERTKVAQDLAAELPACDDVSDGNEEGTDLISLCDLVITAVEHDEFHHFFLHKYAPNATGDEGDEWAVIQALPSAGQGDKAVRLTTPVMREAVAAYADSHLARGMAYDEVRQLVDGTYTDVVVADSIIQFALYGEVVYG